MKSVKIIILIIIAALFFPGCSRKAADAGKPEENTSENSSEYPEKGTSENSEAKINTFGEQGDRLEKIRLVETEKVEVNIVKNVITTEENLINRYFLLSEIYPDRMITPEDFEIGILYRGDDTLSEIVDIVKSFFSELEKGKIETGLLYPENSFFISRVLQEYIDNGFIPEKVRIGKPFIENEKVTVNLRYIKNSGKTAGEVVIIKNDGKWLISEVKGDLSLMTEEENTEKELFEPEVYKFQ